MKSGQKHVFDSQDYARVVRAHVEWLNAYYRGEADKSSRPVPRNPVGPTTLAQYRAAIRGQWEIHAQEGHNKLRWEEIWTVATEQLLKSAAKLVPRMKKKNHEEKIEKDLAPYSLVKSFKRIEESMWKRGESSGSRDRKDNGNIKSALAWMKHRYTFLHSTHSILRCESLFNGELSDFLLLRVPANPHEIWIVIQQLWCGKTNQDGEKLFGRMMRHRDVRVCGLGAFAMYLALRFYVTQEFQDYPLTNWLDNEKWFDVKLLVDGYSNDYTKKIKNNSYGKAVKDTLNALSLSSSHYVHIGRKLGSHELELLEIPSDEINKLGNWTTHVRENRYSEKIPMCPIMAKAGYAPRSRHRTGSLLPSHFNCRQAVKVPEELLRASPLSFGREGFWFLEEHCKHMARDEKGRPKTALHFCELVHYLNTVLMQDLAAMWLLEPERRDHLIFKVLEFTKHTQWAPFVASMKNALDAEAKQETEALKGVETYLPGLIDQFSGIRSCIEMQGAALAKQTSESMEEVRSLKALLTRGVKGVLAGAQGLAEAMEVDVTTTNEAGAMMEVERFSDNHECPTTRAILDLSSRSKPASKNRRPLPLNRPPHTQQGRNQTPRFPPTNEEVTNNEEGRNDAQFPPFPSESPQHPAAEWLEKMPASRLVPRPHPKYASLHSMWEHWNSAIAPLERRWGNRWRSKDAYTPAQQKQFSRINQVVNGIQECHRRNPNVDIDRVLERLNEAYQAESVRCNPEKMIRHLQEMGLLVKGKPRAKRSTDDSHRP